MKQCPRCKRNYADDALSYCLEDGTALVSNYDPAATLINPNPPFPIVPPTVAYREAPVTKPVYQKQQGFLPVETTPEESRRSPWLIGVLVLLALGVGLAIGGLIFQRSSVSSSTAETVVPRREPVVTQSSTPMPATPAAVPSPVSTPRTVEAASTMPTVDQSQTNEQTCVLYNDKSDKSVVNVRSGCDTRNCELDASTIAGEYPDNTAVRVVTGSNVQTARFTWVKVIITDTGRTVWVASSKLKCR